MLTGIKRIAKRQAVKKSVKRSSLESRDAVIEMGKIARATEQFNTESSRQPGLLAKVLAPVYRRFRSSSSQDIRKQAETTNSSLLSSLKGMFNPKNGYDIISNDDTKSATTNSVHEKEIGSEYDDFSDFGSEFESEYEYSFDDTSSLNSFSTTSESTLVHGEETDSKKRFEGFGFEEELGLNTSSLTPKLNEVEECVTPGLTPEPKREKIGLVQKVKNILITAIDFFNPFKKRQTIEKDNPDVLLKESSIGSTNSLNSQKKVETSPLLHEETAGIQAVRVEKGVKESKSQWYDR